MKKDENKSRLSNIKEVHIMDKKALGLGIGIGIVGTGVLNVIGSIVGAAIARKKAKKLVENVLAECDTDNTCTDGCSGKCDTWMPRRAESPE